ncbi:MAG: response regulator transcription factor [Chloroflexi bacterium]|nr:response regulator transcription factor [Chloroflexota bacterium]
MEKIKVLVAQPQTIYREGICSMLDSQEDIEVVGEAENGKEVVEKAVQLCPDVAVINAALPVIDGVEAARRVMKANEKIKIVFLVPNETCEHLVSSVKAAAIGYVNTSAGVSELVRAIRAVHQGSVYFYPQIARVFLEDYMRLIEQTENVDPYNRLTGREREILQLVAEGRTSRQISEMLGLANRTVLGHKTRVMGKLGIHNRTELVKYAFKRGIISVND